MNTQHLELFYLLVVTLVYFLPFITALIRGHLGKMSIFMANVFFGWTVIGWIITLIWSCNSNTLYNRKYL